MEQYRGKGTRKARLQGIHRSGMSDTGQTENASPARSNERTSAEQTQAREAMKRAPHHPESETSQPALQTIQ